MRRRRWRRAPWCEAKGTARPSSAGGSCATSWPSPPVCSCDPGIVAGASEHVEVQQTDYILSRTRRKEPYRAFKVKERCARMCVWMHVQHTRERRLCEANICMAYMARGNATNKKGLYISRAREPRPTVPARDTRHDGRRARRRRVTQDSALIWDHCVHVHRGQSLSEGALTHTR